MEELFEKAKLLITEAEAKGRAELQPQIDELTAKVVSLESAAKEFATKLEAAKMASFEDGYKKGHGDALANLDIKPGDEDEEEQPKEIEPLKVTAEDEDFETIGADAYNDGKASINHFYAVPVC